MGEGFSGNVLNDMAVREHSTLAASKKALLRLMSADGTEVYSPTGFNLTNSVAQAVAIVDTNGDQLATIPVSEGSKTGATLRTRTITVPPAPGGPVQLPSWASPIWGIAINTSPDNTEEIYLGPGSAVNGTPNDSDSGVALWPGDKLELPTSDTDIYAISPTATQILTVVTILV